jgi:hypothetical protein
MPGLESSKRRSGALGPTQPRTCSARDSLYIFKCKRFILPTAVRTVDLKHQHYLFVLIVFVVVAGLRSPLRLVFPNSEQEGPRRHLLCCPELLQAIFGVLSLQNTWVTNSYYLNLGCLHPVARVISYDVGFNPSTQRHETPTSIRTFFLTLSLAIRITQIL